MPILFQGLTHIGQKRSSNQDAIYTSEKDSTFIVADGMGGHNGGDIASQMAVSKLPAFLLPTLHEQTSSEEIKKHIISSFHSTNSLIKNEGSKDSKLSGMGTTINLTYFKGSYLYIANVGDSRTYLVNNKKIFQLSTDHSLVQEKFQVGLYTRDQAAKDPHKNVLTRTVGFEDEILVDTYSYQVSRGDIFIQCSDGLHGKVNDEDMVYLVNQTISDPLNAKKKDIDACCQSLVDLANQNGGNDNISVIVILAK